MLHAKSEQDDDAVSVSSLPVLAAAAKDRRQKRKLSQKKVATLAKCSHTSVGALEKGLGHLNLATAWRIMCVLGLVEVEDPCLRQSNLDTRKRSVG